MLALADTVVKWDWWGKTETFHRILGLEENFVNILLHFLLCQMTLWQNEFSSGCRSQRKEARFSPNLGCLPPVGECLDVGWPQRQVSTMLFDLVGPALKDLCSQCWSLLPRQCWRLYYWGAFSLALGSIHFLNSWLVFSLENGCHFSLNEKRCNCLPVKKIPSSTDTLPPAGSSCLRLDTTGRQEGQGHLVSFSLTFSAFLCLDKWYKSHSHWLGPS